MTNEEKITLLEETLDIKAGTLKEETILENLDEWDSLAVIMLSAMFYSEFNKMISIREIKTEFKTVNDLLVLMEE